MIIQITKCNSEYKDNYWTYWYKDKVGRIFEVEDYNNN